MRSENSGTPQSDNPDPDKAGESAIDAARVVIPIGPAEIEHHVFASSFADPRDVARFRRCKARGGSDQDCFKVGDNGIGFWGDDCTGPTLMCAIPPEDMEERWGSVDAARHKPVLVSANDRSAICIVGDRMPHRAHITNGAGIDLNPPTVTALGLRPPVMMRAAWRWASELLS